jgi:eukaryotic-like serine/threonine-protein kinase
MTEREIFLAALKQPSAGERAAFLDQACGSDANLRGHIEALLAEHEQLGSYLESPVAAGQRTVDEPPIAERPGTVIGPYKLLQQIGEGGMGTVFMAEQTRPVQRKVALKVIKPGMDSRQVIARFGAEQQALALMDHVNVARVLDAGATEAGRPYFVMELVHGVPITKYCDENRLTPKERLELFVPVCQAIQHAHQKGIIHRDIKPSNVMITLYDGKPVPKVIDFGVAKATEQKLTECTLFTQYGTMVGTLEYMSPEQAEMSALGVDTRSDIFSLGVLLYELLTGSTPLTHKRVREAAYAEILHMIKEEEPPRPSTRLSDSGEALASISANRHTEPAKLTKLVRGELDWIVMKALEKDRNRRYETANDFAADVQRYLNDEPVQACPPSAWYRLRKFARRNKGPVTAGLALLALLVLGTVGTSIGLAWALQAESTAAAAYRAEAAQRQRAEDSYRLARQTWDEVAKKFTEDPRLKGGELEDLRRLVLQAELAFYQRFVQLQGAEPKFRAERGRAFQGLGRVTEELAGQEEALGHHQQALDIFTSLVRDHPSVPDYQANLARSHIYLGIGYAATGKAGKAEDSLRTARDLYKALADNHPNVADYRSNLAICHNNLAELYQQTNRAKEAERNCEDSLALYKALAREHPKTHEYRAKLATIYNNLQVLYRATGRPREAEQILKNAWEARQALARDFPKVLRYQFDLADSHSARGTMYRDSGRPAEAETAFLDALAIRKAVAGDHPLVAQYQGALAGDYHNLGTCYYTGGNLPKGDRAYQDAIAIYKSLTLAHPKVPAYQASLARSHNALGLLCVHARALKRAEQSLQEALAIQKALVRDHGGVAKHQVGLAQTINNLGIVYEDTGRPREAEQAYTEGLSVFEALARDHPLIIEYGVSLGGAQCNLGNRTGGQGRYAESREWFTKAVATLQAVLAKEPQHAKAREFLRNAYRGRANTLVALGRHAEALADLDRAVELDHGQRVSYPIRLQRATALARLKRHAEATAEANAFAGSKDASAAILYDVARVYALSVMAAGVDPPSEQYAARAVELLRRAIERGYQNVARLKRDPDLGVLRPRADFQKLLSELGKPPPPK